MLSLEISQHKTWIKVVVLPGGPAHSKEVSDDICKGSYALFCSGSITAYSGIILSMRPANERRRYNVTSSLIGWAHSQNYPRFVVD